jgi:hypothetical protein
LQLGVGCELGGGGGAVASRSQGAEEEAMSGTVGGDRDVLSQHRRMLGDELVGEG